MSPARAASLVSRDGTGGDSASIQAPRPGLSAPGTADRPPGPWA